MSPPRSRSRRRIGIFVSLLLGLLIVWRVFMLLMPPPEHQKVRLADGTVVELLGYSFGKKHELRERPPTVGLRSLLSLLHPAPVIRAADTDRDVLLLWVRVPHKNEQWPGDFSPYTAVAKDANGGYYPMGTSELAPVSYRIGNPYGTYTFGTGGKAIVGEEIMALPVLCYPQRDARFAVELAQERERRTIATFQIANPDTVRPAPFAPEALPAVRREKDLQVTLDSVTPRPRQEQGIGSQNKIPSRWDRNSLQVTLAYTYRGLSDPNWKISELEAYDAMGNRTRNFAPAPTWPCRAFAPPSPTEPYKLRLGVQKTRLNRFDPEEIWTVKDIPLPTQGKSVPLHGTFERDDLHLQLVSIYGMDGRNFSKDMAIVRIKVDTSLANPVLLPRVEDEQGHTIVGPWSWTKSSFPPDGVSVERGTLTQAHTGYVGDNDPHYRTIPLKIPQGTKRLNLFFSVPRTHFVEFTLPTAPKRD